MAEEIPINPDEYAHQKSGFTDVYNREFQQELREAGENIEQSEQKEFERHTRNCFEDMWNLQLLP